MVPAPRQEGAAAPAKTTARLEQELERIEAGTQALKDSAAALKDSMLVADAGPAAAVALEYDSLAQRAAESARLSCPLQTQLQMQSLLLTPFTVNLNLRLKFRQAAVYDSGIHDAFLSLASLQYPSMKV